MEKSLNTEKLEGNEEKEVRTSSTDSKDHPNTTGDNQAQEGIGIATNPEKQYEKSTEAEEYIEDVNIATEKANDSPVQNGKGMTMLASGPDDEEEEDDDDEDDDDGGEEGDPFTIGDDPGETTKKLPVM